HAVRRDVRRPARALSRRRPTEGFHQRRFAGSLRPLSQTVGVQRLPTALSRSSMSSSADVMSKKGRHSVVPPATLTPPVTPASHVLRSAVLERVASTVGDRLVLVRAAAGFGKTTLMAQLRDRLAEDGVDTAWLTLDAADNDTARFLAGL